MAERGISNSASMAMPATSLKEGSVAPSARRTKRSPSAGVADGLTILLWEVAPSCDCSIGSVTQDAKSRVAMVAINARFILVCRFLVDKKGETIIHRMYYKSSPFYPF